MKGLLIYAHPNEKSYTHAVVERLQTGLILGEHEVQTIDLYKEEFDPVLVVNASRRRRDLRQDPYTERYRNRIAAADHLIVVYPVWWHRMPAMMRGFMEKTLCWDLLIHLRGGRRTVCCLLVCFVEKRLGVFIHWMHRHT